MADQPPAQDNGLDYRLRARDLLSALDAQELAILEQRARALSHAALEDTAQAGDVAEVLTFQLAGETYAIPVEYAREVRPLTRLTRVPCTPDFVIGVINLRGIILSLIDIRKFFGVAGQEITDLWSFIIVEAAGIEVGVLANRVSEVVQIPLAEFKAPPATVNGPDAEYIDGVSPDNLILLNLEAILGDPRMVINDTSL